jgi:VWFA-related protein
MKSRLTRSPVAFASLAVACSLAVALFAAAPLAAQGGEEPASVFLDTTDVEVIDVDVFVTDKDGRSVTGLGVDDFVLLENGKPVPISNFFAIEDGRAVSFEVPDPNAPREPIVEPPPVPTHLLVFVDNVNLHPMNRRRAIVGLREFLRASWNDQLRAALVSNDRVLVIHQSFTNDQRRFFAALDRLENQAAGSEPFELEEQTLLRAISEIDLGGPLIVRDVVPGVSGGQNAGAAEQSANIRSNSVEQVEDEALSLIPQLQAYASARQAHMRMTVDVLGRFVGSVSGVEGRKAALHLSDGLELRPGATIFDAFGRRFRNLPRVVGRYSATLESANYDLSEEFEALVASANAARVTLYTVDVSPPNQMLRQTAESSARPTGDRRDFDPRPSQDEANDQAALRLLAAGTGGRFSPNPAGYDEVLQATFEDFDHYYSLGYQVPPVAPGTAARETPYRFEVRTKNPDLRCRFRTSAVEKSADQTMADRTMSGLLLDSKENPLEAVLRTAEAVPNGDGTWTMPVSVLLPLSNLVLLPSTGVHEAQVALFVSVLDEERRTSDVSKNLCPIRIRNEQLPGSMARPISCALRLKMRPGPQRVAIGVRDELAAVESVVSVEVDVGAEPVAGGG